MPEIERIYQINLPKTDKILLVAKSSLPTIMKNRQKVEESRQIEPKKEEYLTTKQYRLTRL